MNTIPGANDARHPLDAWLLAADAAAPAVYRPSYGDITALNDHGLIKRSVDRDTLAGIVHDVLSLLGTSCAVYERDGSYAFGIFSSGWCHLLDEASFRRCGTEDLRTALASGRWLCHESCWTDASRECLARNAPVDVECHGGLRIQAVPIQVDGAAVGVINFGHGSPPRDPEAIRAIAGRYGVPCAELSAAAADHQDRPGAIVALARRRLANAAALIGGLVKRRLAEEALQEAHGHLADILANISDGFFTLDDRLRVTHFNPAAEQLLGRRREEVLGRPLFDAFPEARGSVFEANYTTALRERRALSFETRFDVPPFANWYEVRVQPIGGGIAVFFQVISGRKRSELALRESEEKYRLLVELAQEGIWRIDAQALTTYVNPRLARMFGYAMEEMLGKPLLHFMDDQGRALASRLLAERQAGAADSHDFEFLRKDGRRLHAHLEAAPILDGQGRYQGAVAMVADITERKRVEDALRESEERHRATLESMTDLVFILDAEDRFVGFHAPKNGDLALPPAAFLGRTFAEALPPPVAEALAARIKELRSAGRTCRLDYEMSLPSGQTRWSALVTARLDAGGRYAGATIVSRNVTEQARLEEQLRQREKMDAVGQLAGGIAHDFNNQLAAIIGFTELLQDRLKDPAQQNFAANIMAAARRSADLTRQLLAFARKGKYRNAPVDVHRVAREAAALLERGIDKRIRIELRLAAERCLVLGDASQLQNAILNLGLNARDAMPRGGELVIATRVYEFPTTALEADLPAGRYLQVGVTDTGVGMDAATKRRVFEPFFTTKEVGKGTGLGLASVYGTVRNHGGVIRVYSEPGNGSTFNLYLPLLGECAVAEDAAVAPPAVPSRSGRVLLVDDEPMVLAAGRAMLESLGCSVRTAADPEEALAAYRPDWRGIDLVILDMVMPKMGGRDLFLALRAVNPDVKAILASGYSINGEAQSILDTGVLAFLQKPFVRAELAQRLSEVLGGGR